jgi:hypothetical protein
MLLWLSVMFSRSGSCVIDAGSVPLNAAPVMSMCCKFESWLIMEGM